MFSAVHESFYEASVWNDLPTLKNILEEEPTLLNIGTSSGETALMAAVREEHLNIIVYLLLQPGILINARNQEGETAVHYAVAHGKTKALELLINAGAKLDICDIYQVSPLCRAAYSSNLEMIKTLLSEEGVDINQKVAKGHILSEACKYSNSETILYFLEHPKLNAQGYASTSLICLLKRSHSLREHLVEKLLARHDLDVNISDTHGHTPLLVALQNGLILIAEKILDHPSINLEKIWKGNNGDTPTPIYLLFFPSILKKILHRFSSAQLAESLNIRFFGDNTLLMTAAERGLFEITEYLLTFAEIDINAQNTIGETAFMLACKNSHHQIALLLLQDARFIAHISTVSGIEQKLYLRRLDCTALTPLFSKKLQKELWQKSAILPRTVSDSNMLFSCSLVKQEAPISTLNSIFSRKRHCENTSTPEHYKKK